MHTRTISDPIFHDVVKAMIHYHRDTVLEACKEIPALKRSRLLTKAPFWTLHSSDEEFLAATKFRNRSRIDVVWFFTSPSVPHQYRIIHEIKTGRYDIDEIFHKYHSGMETQIWIWGWHEFNAVAQPSDPQCTSYVRRGIVKKLDIECLVPIIRPILSEFCEVLHAGI